MQKVVEYRHAVGIILIWIIVIFAIGYRHCEQYHVNIFNTTDKHISITKVADTNTNDSTVAYSKTNNK